MRIITTKSSSFVLALAVTALFAAGTSLADSCGAQAAHKHAAEERAMPIFQLAGEAGFKTLTAAIEVAGLAEILTEGGPFTVFAPTDEAFAKLPEGTVESLLEDPKTLKSILLYHVTAGKVLAEDVVALKSAMTLNGQKVKIMTEEGVMINNANVIKTDVMAENGVIHVIDTVLLPQTM